MKAATLSLIRTIGPAIAILVSKKQSPAPPTRDLSLARSAQLGHQLFLAGLQSLTHLVQILVAPFGLRENAAGLLFFLYVMLDVFAQHLDLGIVEFIRRLHRLDLGDQLLGA